MCQPIDGSFLLPKTVTPIHYDLRIELDLFQFSFIGEVNIHIKITTLLQSFRINAHEMKVSNAYLILEGTKKHVNADMVMESSSQTTLITLSEEVPAGLASLHIEFSASLDTKMKGLYRAKYIGSDGSDHWMAVTQFEAASARCCFPCFDEPAYKATFSVTISVPKELTALSNMPEESSTPCVKHHGHRLVTFQKSPIMSTYLLAIVVGEYDFIESKLESGVQLRVFTPKGISKQGEFALEVAGKALVYYTDYFQIPYPLPKLDLITVPDFSAGAMENWGLVTYRESLLLCDPVNSSASNKQRVALVIAHELAHQWFGNLVTMKWWTDLWLNEGYANFSQTLCANEIFPEYHIWTQFLSQSFIPALNLDSLDSTHPVEVEVESPESVDEIFDEISYDKGASVIRMLHHYLGENDFRKGMVLYLKRHQYSNTCTDDLWKALSEVSQKPVESVMSAWTKQPGFPMVSVEAEHEGDQTVLHLTQSRFSLKGKVDPSTLLWAVPIDVVCSMDNKVHSILMKEASATLVLPKLPEDGWLKVNSGACGFYRTKYSKDLLKRLIPLISSHALSVIDRINVLDDLLAMVKAGHSSTVQLLEIIQAYKNEDDYSVFVSVRNCIVTVSDLLLHMPGMEKVMNPLVQSVFANIYQKLGWETREGESYLDKLLRPLVLGSLGEAQEKEVVDRARADFSEHIVGDKILPADLRACVYRICMVDNDKEASGTLIKLFKAAESQEERDRISRCFGTTSDPNLIEKVIDFTMKEVRPQDIPFVLYFTACHSLIGAQLVWNYFKTNHAQFFKIFGSSDLMIRVMKFVTSNFASEEAIEDIEDFFEENPFPSGNLGVQQNIESIRMKERWLKRDGDAIRNFMKNWK